MPNTLPPLLAAALLAAPPKVPKLPKGLLPLPTALLLLIAEANAPKAGTDAAGALLVGVLNAFPPDPAVAPKLRPEKGEVLAGGAAAAAVGDPVTPPPKPNAPNPPNAPSPPDAPSIALRASAALVLLLPADVLTAAAFALLLPAAETLAAELDPKPKADPDPPKVPNVLGPPKGLLLLAAAGAETAVPAGLLSVLVAVGLVVCCDNLLAACAATCNRPAGGSGG